MDAERVALFRGDKYYPRGGWEDFAGWFSSVEAAEAAGKAMLNEYGDPFDWWHVVRLHDGIVSQGWADA